ncbi:DUF397 domain-containing protein [Streptomyces fuscichromogenes]|uniref:DUF397 domain-containing protein n=1 Tax=Streptomyces fuscichromogenes TaxID=1324013 RepID=UPI00382C58F2
MLRDDLAPIPWRKSSYSGTQSGECCEVALLVSEVRVRDSKVPGRAVLRFSAPAWRAAVAYFRRDSPPEASVHSGDPARPARRTRTRADPGADGPGAFAGYCLLTGVLATAAGAGASLLGGDTVVRLVLWGLVLVLVAGAAGWWWAWAPATARRRTAGLWARPAARDVSTRRLSRRS